MDRYQALRELPFSTVIEALGFAVSDYKPRKGGSEWAGKCPCHRPKRNSTAFSYNVDGRWACFSCSAKGRGPIDLVMQVRKCGFQEAVAFLEPLGRENRPAAAINCARVPQKAVQQEVPSQNEAKRFTYEQHKVPSPWLEKRGLSAATLERYGVFQYENPKRQSAYRGKVLIRMQRFSDGEVVGYLARDVRSDEERGQDPKYVMPTGLHKQLEVFGAWQLREKSPVRIVYVVESPFAVMRFHEMGLPAVSPYGWSVSEQQARIICQLAKGVVCLPDAEKRDAFEQSAFLLSKTMWARCPAMPAGVADPESLSLEQIKALA